MKLVKRLKQNVQQMPRLSARDLEMRSVSAERKKKTDADRSWRSSAFKKREKHKESKWKNRPLPRVNKLHRLT